MNAARIVFIALTITAILGIFLWMGAEVIATRRVVTFAGLIMLLFVAVSTASIVRLRKHE